MQTLCVLLFLREPTSIFVRSHTVNLHRHTRTRVLIRCSICAHLTRRLQKDPVQRPSAQDALDHPWLADMDPAPCWRPRVLDAVDSYASLKPVVTDFSRA